MPSMEGKRKTVHGNMVVKWLSGHSYLAMMAAYLPITGRERELSAESTCFSSRVEREGEEVCSSKSLFFALAG